MVPGAGAGGAGERSDRRKMLRARWVQVPGKETGLSSAC